MANRKRLFWQLFVPHLLIIILSVLAAFFYSSRLLKDLLLTQTESNLRSQAALVEEQIRGNLPLDSRRMDAFCKNLSTVISTRLTVVLPDGKVLADSDEEPSRMDNHLDRPEISAALKEGLGTSIRYSPTLGKRMMYLAVPLKENGTLLAIVRTSVPIEAVYRRVTAVQSQIGLGGLIVAVLAAICSFLVYRRIKRPIVEIRKGAMHFAQGEFQRRLPQPETEELASLADAVNQMASELQQRISTITQQRKDLEAVFSSMTEGIFGVDVDEHILGMNNAAARILDCDPLRARGRSIQEVFRIVPLQRFIKEALASEEPLEEDIPILRERELMLSVHGTPLRDEHNRRSGALIVLHDITRLQRLEKLRRDFVANASHEIKTPITAIKGFVETLREGAAKDPEDADRFLGIIQRHVDRLENLVEDLLTLSRIEDEAEKEEVPLSYQSIKGALVSAIQLCDAKASAKNIRIDLACGEASTASINAPLLEQAMVNLLDNAINYSEGGRAIRVEAEEKDTEILIHVQDQGCGIEKDHLDRLFERFYRVDKARSRKMGGTGLGLAIVKHIMEAHKGSVSVQSRSGKGSTFTLHLPKTTASHLIKS